MKIHIPSNARRESGVALLITIMILVFAATVMSTYLLLSEGEYRSVGRSQVWNNSMVLTEAGVEEALALINVYSGQFSMITNWPSVASANGWTWDSSHTVCSMTREMGTNMGSYTVQIDDSNPMAPVITAYGSVSVNLAAAHTPFMLAAAGLSVSSSSTIGRTVEVHTGYMPLFPDAIDSVNDINLNGNNIRVDSFNSLNPLYSDWVFGWGYGTYDINKARANGDVATDSAIVNAISVGNANIYGHVSTGPGGTVAIKNNGYVGPLPQPDGASGITAGWSSDDMNVAFPPVTKPAGADNWQSVPGNNVITNSGNYYISSITSSLTINAPNVNIYVAGSISLSGTSTGITVGTNAMSVNMYVAGSSINLQGNAGINNLTQHASVFSLWGLPSLTSINFGGNANYSGTIYAPEAAFSFGGGGNNSYDYMGSAVVNSVTFNGHSNFHYDESLSKYGPGRGYVPTSWKEITGN